MNGPRPFRLFRLYHPSHHVPDLDAAEAFFRRVFGRPSTRLNAYSTFTPIADVLFDSIDPTRYRVAGTRPYPAVESPQLRGFGWYVDGIADLYRTLRSHGFTLVDQLDRVADGDDPPHAVGAPMPLFFTTPADAGLRYELLPRIPFPPDPRLEPGWELPPVTDDDPLGIVRCAHHTVLTAEPARALRLVVDVLGGRVVAEGRDELLGASGPYVEVADAVVHYATPDGGRADRHDAYHSITWQVADLARVERHLIASAVRIAARTPKALLTDPATGLGIPWSFTTTPSP